MGKLAQLAGTNVLTGPVTITKADGSSMTYDDETAAEKACGGDSLFHHRGAFYEKGCSPRGHAAQPAPAKPAAPKPAAPATTTESGSSRRRRRRGSEDSSD